MSRADTKSVEGRWQSAARAARRTGAEPGLPCGAPKPLQGRYAVDIFCRGANRKVPAADSFAVPNVDYLVAFGQKKIDVTGLARRRRRWSGSIALENRATPPSACATVAPWLLPESPRSPGRATVAIRRKRQQTAARRADADVRPGFCVPRPPCFEGMHLLTSPADRTCREPGQVQRTVYRAIEPRFNLR